MSIRNIASKIQYLYLILKDRIPGPLDRGVAVHSEQRINVAVESDLEMPRSNL